MAVIIELPKLSDTMEEGRLAGWLKAVGDFVEEGEPLAEIETDKATMEYMSPEEGTLLAIIQEAGQTMPLRTPIAVIGEKGEKFELQALLADHQALPHTEASASQEHRSDSQIQAPAPEKVVSQQTGEPSSVRVKASPLAKKLAKSMAVELSQLKGTGPGGRILAADVKESSQTLGQHKAAGKSANVSHFEDRRIDHTMMRKTIAKRLLSGKNDAPHFYLTLSADMGAMLAWRQQLNHNPQVLAGELPKVSVNDLIILAVAKALRKHPRINASWHDDHIMEHGAIDISMAVALPQGLVTPVIRNADQWSIRDIASQAQALGLKAREGQLTPDEYTGGTFTISNLGMTRIEEFTAIINPPQACILAVGTVRKVPEYNEHGELYPVQRMKMTLSSDHRVVDGMVGAQFLQTVVDHLEQPLMMLA